MRHRMIRVEWLICLGGVLILTLSACAAAQPSGPNSEGEAQPAAGSASELLPTRRPFPLEAGAPRLFFSDLESGPNSGGEGDQGAFVTLYGEGFGMARGDSTVTVGGGQVARYVEWGENNAPARGLDMIVVQLGAAAETGELEVTVGGQASNGLPFTVRPGNIYFVSTAGEDAADGSFERPFATIAYARSVLQAGDIAYIMDGVSQTVEDNFGAALAIDSGGEPGAPKALIAYPGAIATIGTVDPSLEFALRVPNVEGVIANDWVIAKLVFRARNQAIEIGGSGSSRWRLIGNDISCPIGDAELTACFVTTMVSGIAFLGNDVHDIGQDDPQRPAKTYHAVYFSTDTNHVEVAWNDIHDNDTCRALQFHSSPLLGGGPDDPTGHNQYDLLVHDNLIHGTACDGINFATVDPSQGPVRAFNNIIFDVGRGPSPRDEDANYACVYVSGGVPSEGRPEGAGTVEIFNNTLYACGRADGVPAENLDRGALSRGPASPSLIADFSNNIVVSPAGENYIAPTSDTSLINGSNNLFFGNGPGPDFLANNIDADPLLTDPDGLDFHLAAGSPAIDAGVALDLAFDFGGIFRPQGAAIDVGAYEFAEIR